MEARGGVRCSARLNGDATRGGGGDNSKGSGPGRPAQAASQAAALAAERRARAIERAREVEDSPRELRDKCRRLARALRNAKHLVVYTGAGISTAADIPDYRGPHGVWTRLQRGESVGRVEVSLARPTFTHMALTALWARGTLKFVVSQNCDGLHLRAGMPRRALAELHGDMFAERCAACRAVVLRAFDTTERTARHAHGTRRLCHACGAELRDSIVHFGERGRAAWPLNWAGALRHASRADVVLCLGSSLKVLRRYPRLWRMRAPPAARPALYIVNLQWTPKDAVAALKINARVDAVMRQVARRLRLRVPPYRAADDPLLAHAEPLAPPERHTTRRPLLPLPPPPTHPADHSDSEDHLSSPSASDSDEELPLRHLAARLRAPPPAPPPAPRPPPEPPRSPPPPVKLPPPATRPPPDLLRAFQVSMRSGEATILLRAQHAPAPASAPAPAPVGGLRAYRRPRPPPPAPALDEKPPKLEPDVKPELRLNPEPDVKEEKPAPGDLDIKYSNKVMNGSCVGVSARSPGLRGLSALGPEELAAAIIARAVLVCRAQLYPGLHTILAPARHPDHCAWCFSRRGSPRCLWYGPPRLTPLVERAWRRRGARRSLCACCDAAPTDPAPAAPAPDPARDDDGGGWYGKGYRKGRRRRR